jgi:glycosyltransferase involved in cell wall biosynthesis
MAGEATGGGPVGLRILVGVEPSADQRIRAAADELVSLGVRRVHSFSWRDLDDEEAGGSEVHHDHVFSRWAAAGLDISHRSSTIAGARSFSRNGYRITQRGSRYTVFPRAMVSEVLGRSGPRDAVVEIWNGVPWFSPVWHRGPQVTWLHHVHGPMWDQSLPRPLAPVGRVLESRLAPRFYRRHPIITLAPASRDELVHLGFPPQNVKVVPPGVDPVFGPDPGVREAPHPLVVATGRLSPVKRFHLVLEAVHQVRHTIPETELVIVGEGPERPQLEAWIEGHDASHWARLAGRVPLTDLVDTYRRAWVVASASLAEGWGMTLTEGGACGTPAVATDVVGHRGAVLDGVTGLLVRDPGELATGLVELLGDNDRRHRMGAAAVTRGAELTWDRTAAETLEVLLADARGLQARRTRRR